MGVFFVKTDPVDSRGVFVRFSAKGSPKTQWMQKRGLVDIII
jgi:hypothetical protein